LDHDDAKPRGWRIGSFRCLYERNWWWGEHEWRKGDPHVHSTVAYEVMERDEVDYEAIVKGEQVDDSKNPTGSCFDQFV